VIDRIFGWDADLAETREGKASATVIRLGIARCYLMASRDRDARTSKRNGVHFVPLDYGAGPGSSHPLRTR